MYLNGYQIRSYGANLCLFWNMEYFSYLLSGTKVYIKDYQFHFKIFLVISTKINCSVVQRVLSLTQWLISSLQQLLYYKHRTQFSNFVKRK